MTQPRVGLLPLYLELYDSAMPQVRPRIEEFRETIASQLRRRKLDVAAAPVCRTKDEFARAIGGLEEAQVDALVTIHLAYSPSLESADALRNTRLPIIVLDTTPTYSYGPRQDPAELMFNHGIHGVQDMCNVLLRNGKSFQIEAGHWEQSDVLDRVAGWARAARLAARMRTARVGRIGEPFVGMGDFAVEAEVLRTTIGVETIPCDPGELRSLLPPEHDEAVDAEMAADVARFSSDILDADAHRQSVRIGLAVRRWVEKTGLSAFTVNFLAFTKASGLLTVPFLEASKAMSRGVGYAGEGDVLTAALVGALASNHSDTTFTEMFCPDWEHDSIYLSHMGEMNLDLAADKPVLIRPSFPWTDADDPVVAVGRLRGGGAVLVNLAPARDDRYNLVVAPVDVIEVPGEDRMGESVHGWFRPAMPIADFLAAYSRAGGTHHCALVYGDIAEEVIRFGELMAWNGVFLGTSAA